jgi:ribosomal protein S27AE
MPMKYACGKCGSENMQKVSVIYEAGTSTGLVTGIGLGMDGELGAGMGRTNSSSLLALRLAPPKAPGCELGAVWAVIGVVLSIVGYVFTQGPERDSPLLWLLWLGSALCGLLFILEAVKYFDKKAKHPGLMARWNRQWYCLKCGSVWLED